ncbi:integral membrane protein [Pelomyxa schiedti]|nr:integral membrane protein [Pelomyxa schiedti]
MKGQRRVVGLRSRPWDVVLIAFFFINAAFITYIVDLEQLAIADPAPFIAAATADPSSTSPAPTYPIWPPRWGVDLVHWYARNFDPVLLARPPWWRMTIWLDVLYFGPFYLFAIYAFYKGREWIRVPSLFWAGIMFANVSIILGEEFMGPNKTPAPLFVLGLNLPWLLTPLVMIVRMWNDHPFTVATTGTASSGAKKKAKKN